MLSDADLMNRIADKFALFEAQGLRPAKMYMEASDIARLPSDQFERESHREILETGVRGNLWGATIYESLLVPPGSVAIIPDGIEGTLVDTSGCINLETPFGS